MSVPVVAEPRSARAAEAQLAMEADNEQSLREQRAAKAGIRRRLEENTNLDVPARSSTRGGSHTNTGHGWTRESVVDTTRGAPAQLIGGNRSFCAV